MHDRAARVTQAPCGAAPQLQCPTSDIRLMFQHSVINGVAPVEYWDQLMCAPCGTAYDYGWKTRRLRRAT